MPKCINRSNVYAKLRKMLGVDSNIVINDVKHCKSGHLQVKITADNVPLIHTISTTPNGQMTFEQSMKKYLKKQQRIHDLNIKLG